MVTSIYADTTPLLEAVAAADRETVVQQTLELLGHRDALPAKIAGSVGIPALWGNASPHALSVFAATGRLAEWIRSIPIGTDVQEDQRRKVVPALPLTQGFLAVADAVKKGLPEPHPEPLEPLLPADVKGDAGVVGTVRAAFAQGDITTMQRILSGYFATGTDYRSFEGALFAALLYRYPENGHPLIFAHAGMRVLDLAEWGNHEPALIAWLPQALVDNTPDAPAAAAAREFAADPTNDLGWLRTRLAMRRDEAAGVPFQQALTAGNATDACAATQTALRNGASTQGVVAGMALAAAQRLLAVPEGDRDGLLHVGHVLQYLAAVQAAVTQVQDAVLFPIVYTAAAAVNALGPSRVPAPPSAPTSVGGGLIAGTMLRTLEQQIDAGDTTSALSTARRYVQLGHPARALAGVAAMAAAGTDPMSGDELARHAIPFVAAAGELYLATPRPLAQDGQNALLSALVRLATEARGEHAMADGVKAAIQAWQG